MVPKISSLTTLFYRSLSAGKRGEVYEINGDQVAVIFDIGDSKVKELNVYAAKEQDAKPSIYWIDSMLYSTST